MEPPTTKWLITENQSIDWDDLTADVLRKGAEVPEVNCCEPGEIAAMDVLMGSQNGFFTKRQRYSENYAAMYDIRGKLGDDNVFNCPYGSPAVKVYMRGIYHFQELLTY